MRSDPPTGDELTRLLVSMKQNVLEQVANEPAPAKRSSLADRIIGLSLGVVLLLGVGTGAAFAFGVVPFGGEPGAAPVATPTSSEAVTPSPTPTPTPTPSEYVVEPGQPASRYGLDCATLIDDTVATGLFTTEVGIVDPIVTASGIGIAIPRVTSIISLGGTVCEWSNGAVYNSQYGANPAYVGVTVSILPRPADGWSAKATATYGMPRNERGCLETACWAVAAVNDAWVAVELSNSDPNSVDLSGWDPFVDTVIAAVDAAGPPAAPGTPEPVQLDCNAVVPLEAVRTITGELEAVPHTGAGGWSEWGEARLHAGNVGCKWGAPDSDEVFVHVDVVHEGSWAFERMLLAGTTSPVTLVGLQPDDDEAVIRCPDDFGGSCSVDLRVGQDWFNVSSGTRATTITLAEALLAQLAR